MPRTTAPGTTSGLSQEIEYLDLVKQKLDILIEQEEPSSRWMHMNSALYYLMKAKEELEQVQL